MDYKLTLLWWDSNYANIIIIRSTADKGIDLPGAYIAGIVKLA